MILKVSLRFATFPDTDLDNFAKTVGAGMTGNAAFPPPPVTMAALTTARDDFTTRISGAQVGGPTATAAKNNSRGVLLGMMRKLAGYVQLSSNDDMAVLLSSGFLAMSTDRASTPLEKPHGLTIKNGNSGQLVASVQPVKNTSMYEGPRQRRCGQLAAERLYWRFAAHHVRWPHARHELYH